MYSRVSIAAQDTQDRRLLTWKIRMNIISQWLYLGHRCTVSLTHGEEELQEQEQ